MDNSSPRGWHRPRRRSHAERPGRGARPEPTPLRLVGLVVFALLGCASDAREAEPLPSCASHDFAASPDDARVHHYQPPTSGAYLAYLSTVDPSAALRLE